MGLKDRIASERRDGVSSNADGVTFYRRRLLEEVDLSEFAELSAPQRRARLERVVGRMVSREGPVLSTSERTRLIRQVIDEAIGLGVLEPLLADPTVTEIMVNGTDEIYVERDGRIERSEITFTDEAQLYQTIDRIVSQVNRRVDESSPMVDARLPTGERVNVIIPPLAIKGPTLTIRRFPRLFTLDQLSSMGSVDPESVALLRAMVKAKLNVVISGGTGAGKTTMLNALTAAVPATERIITVEDNAELRLQQPHVVTLEARPSNVEGRGEITIRDLVRNSLRMRPDRIIVGEVRGGETLDMLQALNTGHEGSLVTVHANSCDDAIHRLETLATMSDLHIPFEALRDQINSAIHVIVQIDRFADGGRRISEIAAVASERREAFRLGSVDALRDRPDRAGPQGHGPLHALPAAARHRRAPAPAGRDRARRVRPGRRRRPHARAEGELSGKGRRRAPAAAVRARAGDARGAAVRHGLLAPGGARRARPRRQGRGGRQAPAAVLRRVAAPPSRRPPARQLAAGRWLAAVARRPAAAVLHGDGVPGRRARRRSCRAASRC